MLAAGWGGTSTVMAGTAPMAGDVKFSLLDAMECETAPAYSSGRIDSFDDDRDDGDASLEALGQGVLQFLKTRGNLQGLAVLCADLGFAGAGEVAVLEGQAGVDEDAACLLVVSWRLSQSQALACRQIARQLQVFVNALVDGKTAQLADSLLAQGVAA
jgi:hypothetical protein